MNILTFDIEEWYLEKTFNGGREFKYRQYDEMFHKLLEDLEALDIKATFFCVGKMATDFPEIIKAITAQGHEIGCHSNEHAWLDKMDEATLRRDTQEAIKALEDVSGQKVVSYRAPAFSITEKNKWAFGILAECGIENDSSVFPAPRDFGGYPSFSQDTPCRVNYQGAVINEFPIPQASLLGKQVAFSGGGYFRVMPYSVVNRIIRGRKYNIFYFHLADLVEEKSKMLSKKKYEDYFMEPGTLKNRFIRYIKNNIRFSNSYEKLSRLLKSHDIISLTKAKSQINWQETKTIQL